MYKNNLYRISVIGNASHSHDPASVEVAAEVLDVVAYNFGLALVTRAPSERYRATGGVDDSGLAWVLWKRGNVGCWVKGRRCADGQGRGPGRVPRL